MEFFYLDAPRIQVVLVPSQQVNNRHEILIVLHVPGKGQYTTKLGNKDHYTRKQAASYLTEIYFTLEKRFAFSEHAETADTSPGSPDSSGPVRH